MSVRSEIYLSRSKFVLAPLDPEHEEPVEGRQDPVPGRKKGCRHGFRHKHCRSHEADHDNGRDEEDGIVNIESENGDIVLPDFMIGLVEASYIKSKGR